MDACKSISIVAVIPVEVSRRPSDNSDRRERRDQADLRHGVYGDGAGRGPRAARAGHAQRCRPHAVSGQGNARKLLPTHALSPYI